MDVAYTYGSANGRRASLYAPPGLIPPEVLELTLEADGDQVEFYRISDRSLACGTVAGVKGSCTNHECHRAELGKCQCGRHEFGIQIRKAVDA